MPLIRRGSRGDWVKKLQRMLEITADGIFGPQTESAVRIWQRNHGLLIDGIVGTQTWASFQNIPAQKPNPPPNSGYRLIGTTHVVTVHPLRLSNKVVDTSANWIPLDNFMTGGYQWHHANGETYPLGIIVSDGKVISDRQPHGKPAGTFIVYNDGSVSVKELLSIQGERNVRFAVSGCTIMPSIRMRSAGFTGRFADIARAAPRPVMGFNPATGKVMLAVRAGSTIQRGQDTLRNLGCDRGITLDAGGSTAMKVDGSMKHRTTRRLHAVITW